MYARHALYYTPPPGPLAECLAGWLGWDPVTGRIRPHPEVPGLPRPAADLTERPRKYGAHGTLKPPFHLAADSTAEALGQTVADFARQVRPVQLEGLAVTRIGSFLALTPHGETGALKSLAAGIVRHFDPFRAPPGPQELERRRKARLSPRQEAHLLQWGYPHVMEDFRFHITLTGPLKPEEITPTQVALEAYLAPLLPERFVLDAISHLGSDPATGRFHLIRRHGFSAENA